MAVAFFFGRPERLSLGNWLGILVGMIGVAALVGLDVGGSDLIGVGQLAICASGYAIGPAILSKWMSDLPPIGVHHRLPAHRRPCLQPRGVAHGGWPTEVPSPEVIWSLVGLGVRVLSALAFIVMFAPWPRSARCGDDHHVLNPAVAIVAGALIC